MYSISDLIQKIYMDLFQDDPINVTLWLSMLEHDIKRVRDKEKVLSFSDWSQLSEISTYDDEWINEFQFELTKRAFEFNLPRCARLLFEIGNYRKDISRLIKIVNAAISNSSLECIDILLTFYRHPGEAIFIGGATFLSQALMLGNKIVADHLLSVHNVHPDGHKVIDSFGNLEDYSTIDYTTDSSSCLVYIMISPYLTILEKLDMMSFAISKGATPLGFAPDAVCFDSPIQVAASINVVLLEYFRSIGVDPHQNESDLLYYAVSSKASFTQKQKIIDVLLDKCDYDVNYISNNSIFSVIEWAVIKNGKDAINTIQYLIERGARYDTDHLMTLAQEYDHHDLRNMLFHDMNGSLELYNDLLVKEKELTPDKEGDTNVYVYFPDTEY